jgi:hypothetical protein
MKEVANNKIATVLHFKKEKYMKKLIAGIAGLTLISCSAFAASSFLNTSATPNDVIIHTTTVTGDANSGKVELYVGEGDANSCQNLQDIGGLQFDMPAKIGLMGDNLAHALGLDYTCAQEVYSINSSKNDKQTVTYSLHNNGQIYDSTDPSTANVEINQ